MARQPQLDMCRNAMHTATTNMLREAVAGMERKRHNMMEHWRSSGKPDALWAEIMLFDEQLDKQIAILLEMERA